MGTWNLAGRRQAGHVELLFAVDADVWLLTEVSEFLELPGYTIHRTQAVMAPRRRWAAVASREPVAALADPHPASAMAVVGGRLFVSSILPWRGCGARPPWKGDGHAARTQACLDELMTNIPAVPLVWGGDWNHALAGPEVSGSIGGRGHVLEAVARLGLRVPTANAGRSVGRASIDHIAVGLAVHVRSVTRIDHGGLSDHDAYVVDTE